MYKDSTFTSRCKDPMASCEMCGTQKGPFFKGIVEGTQMNVCSACMRYASSAKREKEQLTKKQQFKLEKKREREEAQEAEEHVEKIELIVTDFAQRIKNAREKNKLKQEELAKKLAEKESLLHTFESGKRKPSFALARKLEKALGITLIETVEDKKPQRKRVSLSGGMTIGDLLK